MDEVLDTVLEAGRFVIQAVVAVAIFGGFCWAGWPSWKGHQWMTRLVEEMTGDLG